MIKPITLGNKSFPVNIIQGPLAGISCAPFRRLTWKYSQPAFSATEMISCKTLIHQPVSLQKRFVHKASDEGPVAFQLASNDPIELAEGVKRVTDYGADLIDLNCGCPVKKIRSKGSGSLLLTQPVKLYKLICAMRESTHLPISIKIRVDGGSNEKHNAEIVKVVNESGLDFLIVHGRHWTEHYETSCRYDEIQFFADQLKIPVIGNGDVSCVNSLRKMLATGCQGVMIGRAGVGQPWLISQLITEMKNEIFTQPSIQEIGHMFIEHVEQLAALLINEKFAILQARKFAKYYAKKLDNRSEFCEVINQSTSLLALKIATYHYFCY